MIKPATMQTRHQLAIGILVRYSGSGQKHTNVVPGHHGTPLGSSTPSTARTLSTLAQAIVERELPF